MTEQEKEIRLSELNVLSTYALELESDVIRKEIALYVIDRVKWITEQPTTEEFYQR